ncbi:MAG TPA: diacylglycerol kinase family protein [Blastocatellia bacterium]|nr:diacylglycerol kinase family protein [Blastocatellia bacterium]
MTGKRATIIYNPMSGRPGRRNEDAREMIRLLAERGIRAEAQATTGPDDATRLAREAVSDGVDIIISYGGDGTINEVLQAVVGSSAALATWPGGTANVIARDLGVPFDIAQVADMIAAGKTVRVAVGVVRGQGVMNSDAGLIDSEHKAAATIPRPLPPDAQPLKRYFLMMAGIGLDASIARGVNKRLKRRTGEFAYWVTGMKHLFAWQPEVFTIEVDGKEFEGVFAVIGNGKGYGGGMCMTPGARLTEDCFEVYILPRLANNFSYLRALAGCLRRKPETTQATIVRGRHIKANSSDEPWVEADGEVIGTLPMTFDIVPGALSLIVP